jgi:coenzyme PQQ precursor peptide PqqA
MIDIKLRYDPIGGCLRRAEGHLGVASNKPKEDNMAWTTPTLVEICIGLEINGYLPAEF